MAPQTKLVSLGLGGPPRKLDDDDEAMEDDFDQFVEENTVQEEGVINYNRQTAAAIAESVSSQTRAAIETFNSIPNDRINLTVHAHIQVN